MVTIAVSSGTITSLRFSTAYPSGDTPPVHMPRALDAALHIRDVPEDDKRLQLEKRFWSQFS